MNFKELQDEVIANRFDESDRASVKRWINARYQWLWDQADWDFKRVPAADLTITASFTPTMPADFATATRLYDDLGCALDYVEPNLYESLVLPVGQSSLPRASAFTVIDRQIYLWPLPSAATYNLAYKRRLSHVDAALGVTGGIFVEDTDQPLWPAEHDYVLVLEASILGKQLLGDPTWAPLSGPRDELLASMKLDLVADVDEQVEVWGESRVC